MADVYVLRSLKSGKKYVGSTEVDIQSRLQQHEAGKVPWTRAHRPLKLIYSESFQSPVIARQREKFFKTGKGRIVLNSLLRDSGNS